MNVLFAIAEPALRETLATFARSWGYDVSETGSGQAALTALSAADAPALAVLGNGFPDIDPSELFRELRQDPDHPRVYTLLLKPRAPSGRSDPEPDALGDGVCDILHLPVEPETLRLRLGVGRRLMRALRRADENARHWAELADDRAKQLLHADRLSSLGSMTAGIAHEVSTPLAFICSSVELLQMHWDDALPALREGGVRPERLNLLEEDVPKILHTIMRGVDRISGLVRTLNTFCRRDEDKAEETDLHECIDHARQLCGNLLKYVIDVQLRFDPDLPPLWAHPRQIEQVFTNLIKNAADAMNVDDETEGTLRITTRAETGFAVVTVEDSGPGVPEAERGKIWNAFYTTKSPGKGTGLGLAITRRIVEEHGGAIELGASELGGACFTVTLPLRQPPPAVTA